MFRILPNINVDWMGIRKPLIAVSIVILFAGLLSAIGRQVTPGGTNAFNLGVDFQGGTVITAKFRQKPSVDEIRSALNNIGVSEPIIQDSLDKTDEVLIKIPLLEPSGDVASSEAETANQVSTGRETVKRALDTF